MIIPVRCFTCGAVVGHLWDTFVERVSEEDAGAVLTDLGLTRYCCRRMILTHQDVIDHILDHEQPPSQAPSFRVAAAPAPRVAPLRRSAAADTDDH